VGVLGVIFIRSGWYLVLGLVLGFMVYRNTENFRRHTGVSPWGIPPFIWAIVTVFIVLLGTVLSYIAIRTTKVPARRPPDVDPSLWGRYPSSASQPPSDGPAPPGGYSPGWSQHPANPGYAADSPYPSPDAPGSPGSAASTATSPSAASSTAPKPSWHPDPAGRHQLRYWDGDTWTEHVSNAGQPGQDPL